MGLIADLLYWISYNGPKEDDADVDPTETEVYLTGPDLIERIADAIELDQSVVLSGPRGCGKSYCAEEAIKRAVERKLIPAGAKVKLQGNAEFPRDYLAEDDVAFKTRKGSRGKEDVLPYNRHAPLFRFAMRDAIYGRPLKVDGDRVPCEIPRGDGVPSDPCDRFVLFLDEINRFSNGVLDSLLSLLDEREAYLAGETYKLPVVVIMTMNPPGYDASARKLSPPLAARIGRNYRLCSPDLSTLTDVVISERLDRLQDKYKSQAQSRPQASRRPFPRPSADLIRKVALVTLCLWGDVRKPKPGQVKERSSLDYLTPATRAMLAREMDGNEALARSMKAISDHCPFGPDGRAANDWLTTAIGVVVNSRRTLSPFQEEIDAQIREALRGTAVISLSHKIYDDFSPASRPDLTRAKEQAIRSIVAEVLGREDAAQWYDDEDVVWQQFRDFFVVPTSDPTASITQIKKQLRSQLDQAGLGFKEAFNKLSTIVEALKAGGNAGLFPCLIKLGICRKVDGKHEYQYTDQGEHFRLFLLWLAQNATGMLKDTIKEAEVADSTVQAS